MRPRYTTGILAALVACGSPQAEPVAATKPTPVPPVEVPPAAPTSDPKAASSECGTAQDCYDSAKRALDKSPQDFAAAEQAYVRACDQNHAQACNALATMLCAGRSVKPDERRCFQLTEKACGLGLQEGCRGVADFYQMGSTEPGIVAKDPVKAFDLYKSYCDAGDALSCDSLATCYEQGLGVRRNTALARKYHQRAEQLGYIGE